MWEGQTKVKRQLIQSFFIYNSCRGVERPRSSSVIFAVTPVLWWSWRRHRLFSTFAVVGSRLFDMVCVVGRTLRRELGRVRMHASLSFPRMAIG